MDPGARLGHYEILGPLGAGGMGEVYRARDTKLGREVAIKVLPEPVAGDPERLARLGREAQILAALNHPNIATIYGLEEAGGVTFLAMELAAGRDLAQVLVAEGPMPWLDARAIAIQIGVALAAAHDRGIIHRDLKPANVMLADDGTVKVLDFGLAKAVAPDTTSSDPGAQLSASPTVLGNTATGVILGTAAYMSPEQARGKAVDRRTDIWAYGCVLYELLTGYRPFDGESPTDVLAAILKEEPALDRLPPDVPREVRTLIGRCLRKDPAERLRDAGDAALLLREAAEAGVLGAAAPDGMLTTPAAIRPWVAGGLMAVGLALGALAIWQLAPSDRASEALEPRRLSIMADLYVGRGRRHFALSPDGRTLAFVGRSGELFVRRMDEFDARPLDGTSGARTPFFSPDGAWVGYWADGAIYKISPQGGPTQRITSTSVILGASWTADGRVVFSEFVSPLRIVSAQGGEARDLLENRPGGLQMRPHVLPGDAGVLFEMGSRIALASLETGEWDFLPAIDGAIAPAYSPSGHILYRGGPSEGIGGLGNNLWAVPFDLDTLQVTGDPFPADADRVVNFDIAGDGTIVFDRLPAETDQQLVWVDRQGAVEILPFEPAPYESPRLSPDGSQIAVNLSGEIWVLDIARGTSARLIGGGIRSYWPVWTHGGTRITFTADLRAAEPLGLYWKAPGTSAPAEQLIPSTGIQIPISWSESNQELAFYEMDGHDANIRAIATDGTPKDLIVTSYDDRSPRFSPDGKLLAYVSNETGRDEIYIVPYPELEPRVLVSPGGGVEPVWSLDGSALYYRDDTGLMAVPISTGDGFAPGAPELLFEHGSLLFSVTGRGNANYDTDGNGRFLMVQSPEDDSYPGLSIVLNWADDLRRQATAR